MMLDVLQQTIEALGEPVSLLTITDVDEQALVMARWRHGAVRIPIEAPDAVRLMLSLSGEQSVWHAPFGRGLQTRRGVGDLALFAPGPSTVTTVEGEADVLQVFLAPDAVAPGSAGLGEPAVGEAQEDLRACAVRLFAAAHAREETDVRTAAASLRAVVRGLLNPPRSPRPTSAAGGLRPAVVRRLQRLIGEREAVEGAQAPSLEELAREAGLSVGHFLRAFRRTAGMPPHRHMAARRGQRALALLGEERLAIAEVADALGFSSPSHFSAAFRRRFGVTPGEYRVAVLAR